MAPNAPFEGGNVDGAIVTSGASGTALTAAAAASCIPAADIVTLPPNFFDRVGKMIRITATGIISSAITTPGTARFDLRLGAIVVWDSLAVLLDSVAARANNAWVLQVLLTQRAVGAAATLIGVGTFTSQDVLGVTATEPKGGISALLPWNSAPAVGTAFDSRIEQTMDMFFTQTVATGSLTCHQFLVESVN